MRIVCFQRENVRQSRAVFRMIQRHREHDWYRSMCVFYRSLAL